MLADKLEAAKNIQKTKLIYSRSPVPLCKKWLENAVIKMTRFLTAHFSKFLKLLVGQHGEKMAYFTAEQHSAKPYYLPSNSGICLDGHSKERVDSYKCPGIQVDET